MLTDIFASRYEKRTLFTKVGDGEHALFVQAYRIINEQLFPYYGHDQKVNENSKAIWTGLHDKLTMELGIKELSPRYYSYPTEWMGKPHTNSGWYAMNSVCETWITKQFSDDLDPDAFIKRRLSFIELAFREREQQIAYLNYKLESDLLSAAQQDARVRQRLPGATSSPDYSRSDQIRSNNKTINERFAALVDELNERLKQAGASLHYHNGYLQITEDELTQEQIEKPFWEVLKDLKWSNVSIDMLEAIDLRDTGGRDPALYASKALESTIKIICDENKWTTGNEKGASDYLNHLESKANGPYIAPWERKILNAFFTNVRNDFGHGPGSDPMPTMTANQTDQTIEFCMSWIKSLIKRL